MPSLAPSPVHRTLSNTLMAACSTSSSHNAFAGPPCTRQGRRRVRIASAGPCAPRHGSTNATSRTPLCALPATLACGAAAPSPARASAPDRAPSRPAWARAPPAAGPGGGAARCVAAASASVRTTQRGGGGGGSADEDVDLAAPPPPGAAHAAAAAVEPAEALFADLEGAVPYRNGGPAAAAAAPPPLLTVAVSGAKGAGRAGADAGWAGLEADADEVCVVEAGPDGGTTTRCLPLASISQPIPDTAPPASASPFGAAAPPPPPPLRAAPGGATVASVMQPIPDPASASASATPAIPSAFASAPGIAPPPPRTTPSVVGAAISITLRPAGFLTPAEAARMARTDDLTADVTGTVDLFGGEAEAEAEALAGGAMHKQGSAGGSIDMQDTPEGLTDVEVSSVAPVADWLRDQDDITTLTYAVLTGGVVAAAVFVFDVSIQTIHDLPDIFSTGLGIGGGRRTGLELFGMAVPFRCVMPVAAGFAVAWLQSLGFSPPLKVLTRAMEGVTDDTAKAALPQSYMQVARKAIASAITLGSGASLGPEAPSVELGANTAAVLVPKNLSKRRQRMLIAAGAAAGVSAAFDAPVSGALFAVEFVLKSSRLGLDRLSTSTVFVSTSVAAGVIGFLRAQGQALGIAGAGTHLVGRIPYFSIQPNLLIDVAQFSVLGLGCSVAAVALYEGVRVCEIALRPLPRWLSAPTAGVLCGIIAYRFPQVQYGYVNLEEVFRDSTGMSAADLTALLTAKIVATSVCVGGGLVGGLFAPSLFLGALVGDVMGHFVAVPWGLPDPTSLVVVGAAAVLGAACRAPLTAVALMVEITRDTGLLVPLLSAIGVASLFTDYLEGIFSRKLEQALVELYLREKAFFWAASLVPPPPGPGAPSSGRAKTVEDVLGTRARLYVRHTLPLAQAKAAMASKRSSAAVVVDDNFSPLGVVYLEDVEAELIRQRLLNEPDANFNR